MRPQQIVDTALGWLATHETSTPLESAVVHDLAPGLVGWAFSVPFEQQGRANSRVRNAPAAMLETLGRIRRAARHSAPTTPSSAHAARSPLLAVCLQSNATRAFLPVALKLREFGVEATFLTDFADNRTSELLDAWGLSYRALPSLRTLRATATVFSTTYRLRHLWSSALVSELLEQLGLSTSDVSVRSLSKYIRESVVAGATRAEPLHRGLLQAPADNVLYVTRRAQLNALLPHTHPEAQRFFFLQGLVPDVPPIRTRLDVHHAIAGGRLDLPYLLRCGVTLEKITLAGYSDYDTFPVLDKGACRAAYSAEKGLDPTRQWILFTSQYRTPVFSKRARQTNLAAFVDLAHRWPERQFIIKLHPRREEHPTLKLPPNVHVEVAYPAPELIKACDAMVTYWSTTALEALLLRTPLVQLNATGLPDFLKFPDELEIPIARSTDDLEIHLSGRLNGAHVLTTEALAATLGPLPDGQAAHRAATALYTAMRK